MGPGVAAQCTDFSLPLALQPALPCWPTRQRLSPGTWGRGSRTEQGSLPPTWLLPVQPHLHSPSPPGPPVNPWVLTEEVLCPH